MLPTYLSIDGLYSYQTKQEIDFTRLTEAGLFGIFGKVGSGKSSILEAMTFALYGDTNRLNSKNRAYNMMNLNTDHLKIVFEFIGKENKKYSFEAGWKRNGKNFEKISTIERKAYVFENNVKIPLESNDAESVIGISYKNFNRTVIVPQGQFKEFLELKGTDRSIMMKELFNLTTYDLYQKTADLKSANQSAIEHIQGSLQTLVNYTEEAIISLQENLQLKEELLIVKGKEFTLKDEELNKLNEIKGLLVDLAQKKQAFEVMKEQKQSILNLKQRVALFEKTDKIFKNVLESYEKEVNKYTGFQEALNTTSLELEEVLKKEKVLLTDFTEVQNEVQKSDFYKTSITDLENILHYKAYEKELESIKNRLQNGASHIEKTTKAYNDLLAAYHLKTQETEELKGKKIDTALLFLIEKWFQKNKNISDELVQVEKTITDKQQKLTEYKKFFNDNKLLPQTAKEVLKQNSKELKELIGKLQDQINHLTVQKQLAKYTEDLHNGKLCPLCGSQEHPHIMTIGNVNEKLEKAGLEQEVLSKKYEMISQLQNQLEIITGKIELLENDLKEQLRKKEDALSLQKNHLATFVWNEFDANDYEKFNSIKTSSQNTEKNIQDNERMLKEINLDLEKAKRDVERYTSAIKEIEKEEFQKKGQLSQLANSIKQLEIASYVDTPMEEIHLEKEKIIALIKTNEQRFSELSSLRDQLQTKKIHLESKSLFEKKSLLECKESIDSYREKIERLIVENGFNNLEEIRTVLSQNIHIESQNKEIREFEDRFHLIENEVAQLEVKTKKQIWNETTYEEVVLNHRRLKVEKEALIGWVQSLKDQMNEYRKRWIDKKKLLENLDRLELRSKNLSILMNLFKGNGFVNFISTQYLEELCLAANHRFERLTRGQLKLTINEDNDFEVIDHLNSGRKRSVKTLSGGQFFQASLCLALALAESTRSLNKNDKNFFFIDEGFGTQDNESVSLIFETLNNLRNENRIVGIISHVEELQEQIPASVAVVKDLEKGSLIKTN